MRLYLLLVSALMGLMVPAAAPAQDSASILAARRAGLIGERYDGYLGIVNPNASADVRRQVAALNIRRRSLYSSLAARKELAKELHYTGDMNDSASMNVWLHKQVMSKLAANGGKLPPEIKH